MRARISAIAAAVISSPKISPQAENGLLDVVWGRQGGVYGHHGRPSDEFAVLCGQLRVGWHFCRPRDPQAKV